MVTASLNGAVGKVTSFIFEEHGEDPLAVVKTMANDLRPDRLAREVQVLEDVRRRVGGDPVAAALPDPPLFAGTTHGRFFSVEHYDPRINRRPAFNEQESLLWLEQFEAATSLAREPLAESERQSLVADAEAAWRKHRAGTASALAAAVARSHEALASVPLLRCASHGDYWRGNLNWFGGLRVFDWEWARLSADPTFDQWTFELAEIRARVIASKPSTGEVAHSLRQSLCRVERRLARLDVPSEFARATLGPVLARLVERQGSLPGRPNGWELAAATLMSAAEPLILGV
jgi:hypothetical protein